MLEERYTDSIKNEIAKGRTFDEILNEIPTKDATDQEMDAYFDAGDITNFKQKDIETSSIAKVILLTGLSLILVASIISSPFILSNLNISLVFLFPIYVLLGISLSFIGKRQDKAIKGFQTKKGMDIIAKYITEEGYRAKFEAREKNIVRKFFKALLLVVLTPIDFVSDFLINASTILFPTK